jgi:hypothetical protein
VTDLPPRALRRDRLVVGCVLLVVAGLSSFRCWRARESIQSHR